MDPARPGKIKRVAGGERGGVTLTSTQPATPLQNGKSEAMDLSSAVWKKSSRSSADAQSVEVAELSGGYVAVRDSRTPDGPALVFTPSEWEAFVGGVRDGEFDL